MSTLDETYKLRREIQGLALSLTGAELYLDDHPGSAEALMSFEFAQELFEGALQDYAQHIH